jgi:hypothetical protein
MKSPDILCNTSGASTVRFSTVGSEVEIKIVGEEDAIVWVPRSAFMAVAAQVAEEWWSEKTPEERFLSALMGESYPKDAGGE